LISSHHQLGNSDFLNNPKTQNTRVLTILEQQRKEEEREKHTFDDGVNGTALLAKTTIDALGHVNIISRRPSRAVLSFFGLDGDGLGGAYGLAELAGDAPFFARRVAAQSVFAPEPRRDRSFLKRVVNRVPVGFGLIISREDLFGIERLHSFFFPLFRFSFDFPKSKDIKYLILTAGGKIAPVRHTCREKVQS
jgi:hypothetical protein